MSIDIFVRPCDLSCWRIQGSFTLNRTHSPRNPTSGVRVIKGIELPQCRNGPNLATSS